MIKIIYSRRKSEEIQECHFKVENHFYGELNGRYLEGNALSYFDVLTPINLHYISVTMKQKHYELVLQVSL